MGAIGKQGAVFRVDRLKFVLAFAEYRVVRTNNNGFLLQIVSEYFGKILVQVSEVRMLFMRLGETDGDRGAACIVQHSVPMPSRTPVSGRRPCGADGRRARGTDGVLREAQV